MSGATRPSAREVAATVLDPELPVLTLADLGVLRSVSEHGDRVVVTITPTYTGCPALAEMRADLHRRLRAAGYAEVEVRTVLAPPWTTDWITAAGRRKLAEHGIAPPARRASGRVPLNLAPPPSPTSVPVSPPGTAGEPIPPYRPADIPDSPDPSAPGGPPVSTLPATPDNPARSRSSLWTTSRPPVSTLPAGTDVSGPPLRLAPLATAVPCPRCGSADTTELSRFSSTPCKALRRCESCREPFEHVKEI